ncbi:MAG: ribose 5-phosphate isomerase B [Firmicutes bacterium]|nr:ribose 5-phosphate isomerase B [Bacillota bacterium]
MKIALASDHGGFELKEALKKHLAEDRNMEVLDLGTDGPGSVDYPVYGHACGRAVADGEADLGIVCCGTGIGISISANKIKGVRCALVCSDFMAEMTKRHNDANMLAFGGRTTSVEDAVRWTDIWLDTPFEGGRHQRRIDMIEPVPCCEKDPENTEE